MLHKSLFPSNIETFVCVCVCLMVDVLLMGGHSQSVTTILLLLQIHNEKMEMVIPPSSSVCTVHFETADKYHGPFSLPPPLSLPLSPSPLFHFPPSPSLFSFPLLLPFPSLSSSSFTSDEYDAYIVVSFTNATLVLSIGETVEEVTDSGFLGTTPTLACSRLGDNALIQVRYE